MPLLESVTASLNPYLLYIKLGIAILGISVILGGMFYVRSVFAERSTLLGERGKLSAELVIEKQKVAVAMEQLKIWQDTVSKMQEAVKNIKIESNTYIEDTSNAKPPVVDNGTVLPFVMPTSSANTSLPRLEAFSSSRKRADAPKG